MPIGLQVVDVGTVPGDRTGTPARTCFEIMNYNSAVIEAAIEDAELKAFVVKCYAKDVEIAVATAIEWWRQPYAFVLTDVRAAAFQASSGNDVEIDIKENGASILGSNLLTIPAGSETSVGYSPAPDVAYVILNDNSKMTIDVVTAGSGGAPFGLEVTLIGYVIWTSF